MITKKDFNPECITYSQMNLIFNSRVYYRRLITWTEAYIISRYFGIGTDEDLFGRLYLESLDIGNMLQIIFGREYSEEYSQLLSQFAIVFRDLVSAQLAGDTEAVQQNVDRLYQNVADRADFLAALNPYWSAEEYQSLFDDYIRYVIGIANAVASEDFSRAIELSDSLTAHANLMGDVFAQGLYSYITSGPDTGNAPPQNGGQCITYDEMNAIFGIRMFWFDFVIWIRNYMLSRYKGLGNVNEVYTRLRQVPVDYINALRQIFGDAVAEDYIRLFDKYLALLDDFLTAQMENNIDEINRVTQLLYQNADERAAFITSLNPDFWNEEEWRNRLYNNFRSTIDESTTLLTGNYATNIDIFSRLLDQAESTGNYFTQGLFNYLNYNQ